MADLFPTGINAMKYGFSLCFHNPLRWLALTVVLAIPILNLVGYGILLKIIRREEPTFENGGKCFVQGLLAAVILLIYSLIPIGVQLLTFSMGIFGIVLSLVVLIVFLLLLIPGIVNYAYKQTFLSAFTISETFARVKSMTWGRFILALLIFVIICMLVVLIFYFLMKIPLLGWIVLILVFTPLTLFQAKYWSDVFA